MDDILVKASKESSRFIKERKIPEIQLYIMYKSLKHNQEYNREEKETIDSVMSKCHLFSDNEKTKLWEEITTFFQTRTETSTAVKLPTAIKIAGDIWQIKNQTEHCPHCINSKLNKQSFIVDGFSKNSDISKKQAPFDLLTCSTCDRVFVYHNIKIQLDHALEPYKSKVNLDPIDYPIKQVNKLVKTPIKSTTTSSLVSQIQSNFKEETTLHRLGYKITGLNRIQRWEVLISEAIPQMLLKDIVFTIARNIRLRKSQVGGKSKFAYAIAEWEHDLKRLKKEYYRSNFTWPQY